MIYLAVMAVLLFVPSAVFYAAFHLAHHIQSTYRMDKADRNLVDRGILMARVLRK
jgi:hypothetical protein